MPRIQQEMLSCYSNTAEVIVVIDAKDVLIKSGADWATEKPGVKFLVFPKKNRPKNRSGGVKGSM